MKTAAIVSVITVGVCCGDFYLRLSPNEVVLNKTGDADLKQQLAVRKIQPEELNRVNSILAKYDVVKPPPKVKPKVVKSAEVNIGPDIMSKEMQAKQQGKLNTLSVGKYEYSLKACFNDNGQRFAMVEKKDLESNKIEKVTIRNKQSISNYDVSDIGNTSVTLKSGERTIFLQLFSRAGSK